MDNNCVIKHIMIHNDITDVIEQMGELIRYKRRNDNYNARISNMKDCICNQNINELYNLGNSIDQYMNNRIDFKQMREILAANYDEMKHRYTYQQTYDNNVYVGMMNDMKQRGDIIPWQLYVKHHVIYMFIIDLKDPDELNRIFVKIGYTHDIVKRKISLEQEYGARIHFIDIRVVESMDDEQDFHRLIRTRYPHLKVNIVINNHKKDEVYIFDTHILREFAAIDDKLYINPNTYNNMNCINNIIHANIKQADAQ